MEEKKIRIDGRKYQVKYKGNWYLAEYKDKFGWKNKPGWFEISAINTSVFEEGLEQVKEISLVKNKRAMRPLLKRKLIRWIVFISIAIFCLADIHFVIIPYHQSELWTWDNFHPLSLTPDSLNGFICGVLCMWIFYKLILKRKK